MKFGKPWRDWLTDSEIDEALTYLEKRREEIVARPQHRGAMERRTWSARNADATRRNLEALRARGELTRPAERLMLQTILRDTQIAEGMEPDELPIERVTIRGAFVRVQ